MLCPFSSAIVAGILPKLLVLGLIDSNVWVLPLGEGLESNQNGVGYFCNIYATVSSVVSSYQESLCCSSQSSYPDETDDYFSPLVVCVRQLLAL